MDYEKMWNELKKRVLFDVNKLHNHETLTIDIAVRFISSKTTLNTMESLEKGE